MLFVTHYNQVTHHHVGEKIMLSGDVTEVQADSDELEHIKHFFTNIPMSSKNVVVWYGDMAKFIVENW